PPAQDQAAKDGAAQPPAPSFDIVRVEPGGQAVIAGRAAPEAEVEVRSGDRVIDRVRADRRGEWVAVPSEPLGAGVQELSLAARVQDRPAAVSEEVVVVAVLEARPSTGEVAVRPAEAPSAEATLAEAKDDAFAVALPRHGAGKGRILQAPGSIGS